MMDKTLKDEQTVQKNVMQDILKFINRYDKQTTILKGGTGLMFGYNLDRFSEDIDLDSTNTHLEKIIKDFCSIKSYQYNVKKDTPSVKRYMLQYAPDKKIKIEISYRNRRLNLNDCHVVDGIKIYNIDKLFGMKLNAYNSRDKIRDLYDIVFITKNYMNQLPSFAIDQLKDSLSYKGLEQFDYLMSTQDDHLIDKDALAEDFLQLFDELDLLNEKENAHEQLLEQNHHKYQKTIKERIEDAKKDIHEERINVKEKDKEIEL